LITTLHQMDRELLTNKMTVMAQYRSDCMTVGQDISLLRADTVRRGHALSVDDDGALVVRFEDGSIEAVQSGEVSVRGMYGYL
jgi:BirA family biotin operon repressor/biotin-[acetyl-CoA-carboxylase] ligase